MLHSYFSSLFAATRTFPGYPGVASGTVMALFGLSPLLLSSIASTWFTDGDDASFNLARFLSFLAILSGVVHAIGALNLHVPAPITLASLDEEADETTTLLPERSTGPSRNSLDLVRDPYFWVLFMLLVVTLGPVGVFRSLPALHK